MERCKSGEHLYYKVVLVVLKAGKDGVVCPSVAGCGGMWWGGVWLGQGVGRGTALFQNKDTLETIINI